MNVQIIEKDGVPEWAILPYADYLEMVEQTEMLQDINDFDRILNAIDASQEEILPSEMVYELVEGKNPIKIWREYRNLTQKQAAEASGISVPFLSQLESGKRKGTTKIMLRLAKTLQVMVDDLVRE